MSSECAYAIEKAMVKCQIRRPQVWVASHTASYFYLLRGNHRNDSITSCPWTQLRQRLFLEETDFDAGWPVIHSDFKWLLQRLRCLLREPKGKWNKEKRRGNLSKTVQKLLKFYARVQEIHRPDRQTVPKMHFLLTCHIHPKFWSTSDTCYFTDWKTHSPN